MLNSSAIALSPVISISSLSLGLFFSCGPSVLNLNDSGRFLFSVFRPAIWFSSFQVDLQSVENFMNWFV